MFSTLCQLNSELLATLEEIHSRDVRSGAKLKSAFGYTPSPDVQALMDRCAAVIEKAKQFNATMPQLDS